MQPEVDVPNWIDALVIPFLLGLGALASWFIRSWVEHRRALEAQLANQRRQTYAEILDPYIKVFVKANMDDPETQAEIERVLTSYEYRRAFFDLGLFGSDDVVRSYNALMQYTFKHDGSQQRDVAIEMLRLWGKLLLSIRREGNPGTKLTEWEMLEGMIKDIERIKGS